MKLTLSERHLMRLIRKDRNAAGWAKVSAQVWPLVEKLPKELVKAVASGDGGSVSLTEAGEVVLDWT